MILTKAQLLGIMQEFRSKELSEEQEMELLQRILLSERERHGISPDGTRRLNDGHGNGLQLS